MKDRSQMEVFRVRHGYEWATIMIEGWSSELGPERGELVVHSSFGTWGYQWGNMGVPIKDFLLKAGMDYMIEKLAGGSAREFNFEASLACWTRHLVAARRRREISADEFRDAWDASRGRQCSLEMFLHRISESDPGGGAPLWHDAERYAVFQHSRQFRAFWDGLWSVFMQRLRTDREAANELMAETA